MRAARRLRALLLRGARPLRLARDRRWRCVLVVTPDDGAIAEWPRDIPRIGQGRGDLGQRMARAMAAVPAGPVVLVGGDIPGLGPEHVDRAFAALRRAEVVFGPAADGGFWLVGLRRGRRARQLFRDVRWSSPQALTDTLANLPAAARVALVDELADVDTAEDYRRFLDRGT